MHRIDRAGPHLGPGLQSDAPGPRQRRQRGEPQAHRADTAAEVLGDKDLINRIFRTIPRGGLKGLSAVNHMWRAEVLSTITEATLSPRHLLTKPDSSRFSRLRSVTLNAFDDTESPERRTDMLRDLSGLGPALNSLLLRRAPVSRKDWYLIPDDFNEEHVRTICEAAPKLETLTIETRSPLSGSVLEDIGRLSRLKELTVRIGDFSERELSFLKNIGRLEALDLECDSDANTVRKLCAAAPGLKSLRIETPQPLGSDILNDIGRLSELRNLHVYLTDLHAEGLSGLRGIIGQLESLYFRFEHDGPEPAPSFEFLRAAENLRCLGLEPECDWDEPEGVLSIDASHIAPIASLTRLTDLSLLDMPLDDRALEPLSALKGLRALDLSRGYFFDHLPTLSGESLRHLSGMTQLETLLIGGLVQGGDESCDPSLTHLAPLAALKRLDLNDSDIDGSGVAHLAGIPRLTELGLRNCNFIENDGLAEVAKLGPLKSLDLSCDFQPPQELDLSILNGLSGLESLDVRGLYVGEERCSQALAERLLGPLLQQGCRIQTDS